MRKMFVPGRIYERSRIHARFGGSHIGNISLPKDNPLIFIFSGQNYNRKKATDFIPFSGITYVAGAGQVGNMKFQKGNLQIRDHIQNRKDLFLFKFYQKGYVEFVNQVLYLNHRIIPSIDRTGKLRKSIIFQLFPLREIRLDRMYPQTTAILDRLNKLPLVKLRKKALKQNAYSANLYEKKSTLWKRSYALHQYAIRRAKSECEGCSTPIPHELKPGLNFLEVHHINKLTDGGPDDPVAVVALCPNCHRLAHYGADSHEYNVLLLERIKDKEKLLGFLG